MTDPALLHESIARLQPLEFDAIAGWRDDDHAAAFAAFLASARAMQEKPPKTRAFGIAGAALADAGTLALGLGALSRDGARTFFEDTFRPYLVMPAEGDAFFTGYYEPEAQGSRVRTERFTVPIYRRPDDLVDVDETNTPGVPQGFAFARRSEGGLTPYFDRQAVESGALAGRGLELLWLESAVDAFFIQVQGSARVALTDGSSVRIAYSAKSGHPYTPIGRVLRERGALPTGGVTMQSIRAWLAAHPAEAREVMWANRSFVFFREVETPDPTSGPTGAAGVFLTANRSLAVDRKLHTFHTPVWVDTEIPGAGTFRHLMIAQDTGSAIVGPARGDIFFGSGDAAGAIAGVMQSKGRFVILAPRGVTPGATG